MKQILHAFLMLLGPLGLLAQTSPPELGCGYDRWTQSPQGQQFFQQYQNDTFERAYRQSLAQGSTSRGAPPVYTVPTVIHIIHACEPIGSEFNPSDETLQSLVQLWSDRFRHTSGQTFDNPFSGVDTEIQFCLATSDPGGNYTTGIVRHAIPELTVGDDSPEYYNAVKALNWDPELYFNVYFVPDLGGSIAGISVGTAVILEDPNISLFAHEAGHHFGLYHTFNNGCDNGNCLVNGDRVCDTPPDSYPGKAQGSCTDPYNSCNTDPADDNPRNPYRNSELGDVNDIPENYMDYTSNCWGAFTQGQSDRMRATFLSYRAGLIDNGKCDPRPLPEIDAGVVDITLTENTVCTPNFSIQSVRLQNFGTTPLTEAEIQINLNGVWIYSLSFSGDLAPGTSTELFINEDFEQSVVGAVILEATIALPNGVEDMHPYNDSYCRITLFQDGLAPNAFQGRLDECKYPVAWVFDQDVDLTWESFQNPSLDDCFGTGCSSLLQGFAGQVQTASLNIDVLDLSSVGSVALRFAYGYVQRYDFINNTLRVEVSTDCGKTSEVIWSKTGPELSTGPYSDYIYVLPDCTHMQYVDLDLSDYLGEPQVLISFIGAGRYYSPLILDNIEFLTSEEACDGENLSIQDAPMPSGVFRAANRITTTAYLPEDAKVTFKAGTHIRMLPGFQALPGSEFHALIGDCDDTPAFDFPPVDIEMGDEDDVANIMLEIFPNPGSKKIGFNWRIPEEGLVRLDLLDLSGRILRNLITDQIFSTDLQNTRADVSDLPPGTYLVVLQTQQQRIVEKLILF